MSQAVERLAAALADRYRIERELGQGGMATVYLAHDVKHERKVAVKVLRPELAAILGADRFLHEIKVTANLQHPNILALYDSGEADSFLYYVMPLVEGDTLRDKLNREKQLSVGEMIAICTGVAAALDYAHERGVVHRDIKPENILLQRGQALVADFGIALAVSQAGGARLTETGLSLGTPHYMSPEQATGDRDLDARSDVYSLGAMAYEMLTGDPPYDAKSVQAIIAKILTEAPSPITRARSLVPANVDAAVQTALAKSPADRFGTAGAFAAALVNRSFTLPASAGAAAPAGAFGAWRSRAAIPALALAGVLALTTVWALTRPTPPTVVSRYLVELPEGQGVGATQWAPMTVAPDGSRLVYLGENGRLLVRSRDQLDAVELPGTDGAFNPFFSRDGTRVGFMSGQPGNAEIKVASLAGGPPVTVTTSGVGGPGATWGFDGYIYFDASGIGPLRRIPETGGVAEAVSALDSAAGELQHNWPDALPNGRGLVMTVNRGGPGLAVTSTDDIAVLDLATGRHRVLVRGIFARYARSGHILYVTADGVLMGVPFDQDRLELAGSPAALVEGIGIRRGGGGVDLAVSDAGTLWYGTGSSVAQRAVVWASRDGALSEVDPGWVGDFGSLALSPDGTRLALSILDPAGEHIWVKQLGRTRGQLSKVTFERTNSLPRWHPDGRQVVFTSAYVAASDLRVTRADGSALPTVLLEGEIPIRDGSWTRDGRWLVYDGRTSSWGNIYGVQPGVDSTPVPLVATEFIERAASVSPDGRWLLYEADPTGAFEVYVRPFPNASASLTQVSTGGGSRAKWSHDGREIFFANRNNELVRVEVLAGASFAVGEQRTLFSLQGVLDWDLTPDDRRFIMIREREGQRRGNLVVVENFFQELKERVGR